MGKVIHNDVYDAALDEIATADEMFVCSAEPTNYTEASSTYALADHAMVIGDGNGDYTIADGDTSGRKLTVTAQATITIDTTGTATHVALCDSVSTTVLAVTTLSASQALTATNTVTVPTFDIELADPS